MADNVPIDPSTAPTAVDVATDEVGGRHYQWMKPAFGNDGEAIPVCEATPLPVADAAAGNFLQRILQMLLAPLGYDKSLARYRGTTLIESGNLNTVTGLTNLTNINGRNGDMLINSSGNTAWALNVRARIT